MLIFATLFVTAAAQAIIGYFGDWSIYQHNFKIQDINQTQLTHIYYSFLIPNPSPTDYSILKNNYAYPPSVYNSSILEGTLVPYDTHAFASNLPALRALKTSSNIKIILAIGGWTGSWHLSKIMANTITRRRFVQSSVAILQTYKFDGIDLDWEYPGRKGASWNSYSIQDSINLGAYCAEMRAEYARIGQPKMHLSLAASGRGEDASLYSSCAPYLDFIGIMSYDYAGAWQKSTAHMSSAVQTQQAIDAYRLVFKSDQIVIGSPIYGRGWSKCTATNADESLGTICLDAAPTFDTISGERGMCNYKFLKPNLISSGFKIFYDSAAGASYAYNSVTRIFWSYPTVESEIVKARIVQNQKLGGIMFWDVSADMKLNDSIINAVYNTFLLQRRCECTLVD